MSDLKRSQSSCI